jgi:hypothetical protein
MGAFVHRSPMSRVISGAGTGRRILIRRVIVLFALLALGFGYWSYSRSPEAVMRRAVRALETGDAAELLRLTDKVEVARCNLTHVGVAALLSETLGPSGMPRHRAITRMGANPPDRAEWIVDYPSPSGDARYVAVSLVKSPKGEWKLALTGNLRWLCAWKYGVDHRFAAYCEWARRYGVTGVLDTYNDEFISVERMEAWARRSQR